MRFVSTKIHAILDYASAVLLFPLPWILGFNEVAAATWVIIFVALMILTLSLFTNYEGGMMGAVPMRVHLLVDVVTGLALACSPWIFGFADQVYLPHVAFGLFETFAAVLTSPHSKAALPENPEHQKVV